MVAKAYCFLVAFRIESVKDLRFKRNRWHGFEASGTLFGEQKDFLGPRKREALHPGQRGPGPYFPGSPMKVMKHEMDLGDTRK